MNDLNGFLVGSGAGSAGRVDWTRFCGFRCALAFMAVYGLAHTLLRLAVSPNIAQDDVISNLLVQTFEWGYTTRQPPLYEWLLWLVQQATGPTLTSFLLLKYVLLAATVAFLYQASLRIMSDRAWAAAAALSPTLLYQIGWNIHEGVTQTLTLMLAMAAVFWAFLRLLERGSASDWLVFGAATGVGLLSKFGFAAFLAVLLLSSITQPAIRQRIRPAPLIWSLLVATLVASPYFYWLLSQGHDMGAQFASQMTMGGRDLHAIAGIGLALYAPVAFLLPLTAILPALYPAMLPALVGEFRLRSHAAEDRPDIARLVFTMTLMGIALLLLGAVLFGASNYLERYMHVFFLLTPLWLVALASKTAGRSPRRLLAAIVTIAVAVWFVRLSAFTYVGEPFCHKCREAIPYARLARMLAHRGLDHALFVTGYRHTAGNLREHFPGARFITLREPYYAPPSIAAGERPVVLIWDTSTEGKAVPARAAETLGRLGYAIEGEPEALRVPWDHAWRPLGYRHSEWKLIMARRITG